MKKLSKSILIIIIALAMTLSLFACGGGTIYNCDCENVTGGTVGGGNSVETNIPNSVRRIRIIHDHGPWTFISFRMIRLAEELKWEEITSLEFYDYHFLRRRDDANDFVFELPRDNVVPSWLEDGSYVVMRDWSNNTFHRVPIISVATYYQTVTFSGNTMTITTFYYFRGSDRVNSFTFVTNGIERVMREYFDDTLISLTADLAFIEFFVPTDLLDLD